MHLCMTLFIMVVYSPWLRNPAWSFDLVVLDQQIITLLNEQHRISIVYGVSPTESALN